jgi:hypothetical protein
MITAHYVRFAICECGCSVLNDDVPLGRAYRVDPCSLMHGGILCGECGKKSSCDLIQTEDGGWLPAGILDFEGAEA